MKKGLEEHFNREILLNLHLMLENLTALEVTLGNLVKTQEKLLRRLPAENTNPDSQAALAAKRLVNTIRDLKSGLVRTRNSVCKLKDHIEYPDLNFYWV